MIDSITRRAAAHRTRAPAAISGTVTCALATIFTVLQGWAFAAKADRVQEIIADRRGIAVPGCAVGAFRDGQTLFLKASGAADVANKRPLNEHTLFYAASVSKQFTVLALATLVEQGKVGLDDDVRKWIPELPVYERPVTVHMLAHNISGIRDWLGLLKLLGVHDAGKIDRSAAVKLLANQRKTNFVPGSEYAYSNGGFLLLSEVVSRASGMPFHAFAKKAVLAPMGMNQSYFLDGVRPTGANVAHGYIPVGDGFEVRDTYPLTGGSGGLITTLADFAKYDRDVQINHKVWTPAVARIMLTPGKLNDGSTVLYDGEMAYSGGLITGLRKGRYVFEHAGGAEGFRAQYINLPDRHLSVAMVCNRGDIDAPAKVDAIVDILEETSLAQERKARQERTGSKNKTNTNIENSAIGADSSVSGTYTCDELRATYQFAVAKDAVTVTISSPWADVGSPSASFKLTAQKDGTLKNEQYQYRLIPDADKNGYTFKSRGVSGLHFKRVGSR